MLMDVTPRQLRAFLAVAEAQGFTAAARQLGLAQSVASTLVQDLEHALGARLFDRTSRRVALTAAGAAFRPRAAALLADLAAAQRAALDTASAEQLTIAAPPLLAATLLPPAIAAARAARPQARFALIEAPTSRILDLLRAGAADIAIGTFGPGSTADLQATPLRADALALFMPAADPLAGRLSLPWSALAGRPMVALSPDSALRGLTDSALAAAGLPAAAPVFEVAQITTAIALVAAGLGIAALPSAAIPLAPRGRVATARLTAPTIPRHIAALSRPGQDRPAAAALLAALAPRRGNRA